MWIGAIEVQAAFWGGSEGPPPQTLNLSGLESFFEAATFIITTTALSTPPFVPHYYSCLIRNNLNILINKDAEYYMMLTKS